jgi:hypothetical protein
MFSTVRRLRGYAAGGPVEGDPPFDLFSPRGRHFIGVDLEDLQRLQNAGLGRVLSFDRGGMLPPGLSLAYNGTRHYERVTPASSGSGIVVHNHYHFDNYVGTGDDLIRTLDRASRQGRLDAIVRRTAG